MAEFLNPFPPADEFLHSGTSYLDCDDLLCVPQPTNELSLSSDSTGDLLFAEFALESSLEVSSSSSLSSPEASSRLVDLVPELPLDLSAVEDAQQVPAAAPLPLGPHGLKLQLDYAAVAAAWACQAPSGADPFLLRGAELRAAVATLPSTSHLEASLAAATQADTTVATAAAAEAARRREAQRQRERKAAAGKASDRRVAYPARKTSSDKRPRIKGRFVTKAEYEAMAAADAAADADGVDQAVPCCA